MIAEMPTAAPAAPNLLDSDATEPLSTLDVNTYRRLFTLGFEGSERGENMLVNFALAASGHVRTLVDEEKRRKDVCLAITDGMEGIWRHEKPYSEQVSARMNVSARDVGII